MAEPVRTPAAGPHVDWRIPLGIGLLCWAGVAVVAFLVLAGGAGWLDSGGFGFWQGPRSAGTPPPRWAAEMMRDVTSLGGVLLRNVLAAGATIVLLFLNRRREALWLVLTVAAGWLVNTALKDAVGRERPDIVSHLMDAGGPSFPSGHSFNSAVVFVAIALAFSPLSRRRSVRRIAIAVALAASFAVAVSRVWLGVHFPTDVIAGWLGGVGWVFVAAALLYRRAGLMEQASSRNGPTGQAEVGEGPGSPKA